MLKTRKQGAAIAIMAFLWAAPAVPAHDAGFPVAPSVIVNGKTVAHAILVDDAITYVPLRVVTEALGAGVKFDRAKQQIILSPPKLKALPAPPSAPAVIAPSPVASEPAPAANFPVSLSTPRGALKGIGAIFVAPVAISANAETTALFTERSITDEKLRADTEAQLRAAGIPVTDTPPADPGGPQLMTDVTTVHSPSRQVTSYYIHVSVREAARLERDDTVAENTITWQTGMIGYAADSDIGSLRDSVQARVADFIADYLAANPQQAHG
jgi:hypothetical protein